jgi:hypothetical protein
MDDCEPVRFLKWQRRYCKIQYRAWVCRKVILASPNVPA